MDDDEFIGVSEESQDLADLMMEILNGTKTSDGVQAIVVLMTNILAATAPSLNEANEMCDGVLESVKKSLEGMDKDRLCRWSDNTIN